MDVRHPSPGIANHESLLHRQGETRKNSAGTPKTQELFYFILFYFAKYNHKVKIKNHNNKIKPKQSLESREELLSKLLDPASVLKNSRFENRTPADIQAMIQRSFDENFDAIATAAWGEDAARTIDGNMHEKITELMNFPSSLSFTDFEVTTRAKVTQQEREESDASLSLRSEWRQINMTLNQVNEIGIHNLDSPRDGAGVRYGTNLNHEIIWVANKGPVCINESLDDESESCVHDDIVRTDSKTFYNDFMNRLLSIEVKEARIYAEKMCLKPMEFFNEFQKRSSHMFNRDGSPKEEVVWPEAVKLNPFEPANHGTIEEACLADAETRKILGSIDIHRAAKVSIAMTAYNVVEMR